MKKSPIIVSALCMALAFASCSNNNENQNAGVANTAADTTVTAQQQTLNIRYVDGDSIMSKYNLARDVQEFILKTHSRLENARQSRATEIQRFASQMDQKMRNNGYLSEASAQADANKLQKMQEDAERALASMQAQAGSELDKQQQQLNDSIETFVKEYNKTKGYDAILFKTAGIYFNPALDITDEIVEGLNARYNKVSK